MIWLYVYLGIGVIFTLIAMEVKGYEQIDEVIQEKGMENHRVITTTAIIAAFVLFWVVILVSLVYEIFQPEDDETGEE